MSTAHASSQYALLDMFYLALGANAEAGSIIFTRSVVIIHMQSWQEDATWVQKAVPESCAAHVGGASGRSAVCLTYQLLSDLNSMRWHKQGTMKLRLAQASEPTKEMNRPKPGTEIATTAISRTRLVLTAANMRLLDLAPNLVMKLACTRQRFGSQAMHLTHRCVITDPTG